MANGDTTRQISVDEALKILGQKKAAPAAKPAAPTPAPTPAAAPAAPVKPAAPPDYSSDRLPPYPGKPQPPPVATTPRVPGPHETPSGPYEGYGESIEQRQDPAQVPFGTPPQWGDRGRETPYGPSWYDTKAAQFGIGFPHSGTSQAPVTGAVGALEKKVGPPEGPLAPPTESGQAFEAPHPIAEGIKGKAEGLLHVPMAIAYGTGHPVWGRAAGAWGDTASNYVDQIVDHHTKGTPIDSDSKDLLKEFGIHYLLYTGFDYGTKALEWFVPWFLRTNEGADALNNAKNFSGDQRQEWIDRTTQQLEKSQKAIDKARQAQLQRIKPQARQELITKETGATPQTAGQALHADYDPVAGAAVSGPTQDTIAAEKNLRGAYYKAQKKVFEGYGKQYDELLPKDLTEKQLPTDPGQRHEVTADLEQALKEQLDYRKENYLKYKGDVPRLIVKAKRLAGMTLDPEEEMSDLGPGRKLVSTIDPATGQKTLDEVIELPDGTTRPAKKKPTTIGDIYNFYRFARRAAAEAPDKISAEAATRIFRTLPDILRKAGFPEENIAGLRALDSNYRKAILDLPGEVSHGVANANSRHDIANQFYGRPDTFTRIYQNSDAEGKQLIKDNWGDWATNNSKQVWPKTATEADVRARVNAQMFGNQSPLANPKVLLFDSGQANVLEHSPMAQADMRRGMLEVIEDQRLQGARAGKKEAIKLFGKMGPVGAQKIREINAIRDPMQAMKYAEDFFDKMDPKEFARLTAQAQPLIRSGPLEGAKLGRQQVESKGGAKPFLWHMLTKAENFPIYAAVEMINMAMGRGSTLWPVLAVGTGLTAAHEIGTGLLIKGLATPQWEAFQSYLANSDWYQIGKFLATQEVRSTLSNPKKLNEFLTATPQGTPAGTPAAPQPQKTSMNFGPMFNDIERKQATQIATERGRQDPTHIDQVQDLHMQVASGKTPDIHADLASGRLSNEEVTKMLRPTKPGTDSLFDNMSLADAMEAFSHGNDDDKALGLSALAQKIQNEGKNLQPAQRRALMAKLHMALTPESQVS